MKLTLQDLNEKNIKSWKRYLSRERKIEKQIRVLQEKKEKLRYTILIEHDRTTFKGGFIKPIALEIKKRLNAKNIVVYGPFGFGNETTIYWLKEEKNDDICGKGNVLGSLCFIQEGDGWAIRNEKNGYDYETMPITKEMTVEWLLKFVGRIKNEKRARG